MSSAPSDEVYHVSAWDLRARFNSSEYPAMIRDGRVQAKYLRDAHLEEPERVNEPHCTCGQMIRYTDEAGHLLVEVFQYLRSDGTIGASGLPDPKRMWIGGATYLVDHE